MLFCSLKNLNSYVFFFLYFFFVCWMGVLFGLLCVWVLFQNVSNRSGFRFVFVYICLFIFCLFLLLLLLLLLFFVVVVVFNLSITWSSVSLYWQYPCTNELSSLKNYSTVKNNNNNNRTLAWHASKCKEQKIHQRYMYPSVVHIFSFLSKTKFSKKW